MQVVEKARLRPGMVLGQDIYNFGHQIVIKKGTVLSDHQIQQLRNFSILRVQIEDELIETTASKKYSRTAYSKNVQKSPEFQRFQKEYDQEIRSFEKYLNSAVRKNINLDTDYLYRQVVHLLRDIGDGFTAFDMVQNMRHYDDSTFAHSINVGLLCYIFAGWLNFPEEDKQTLTVAGILHDIGKTEIPISIIQKPGKLNDEEFRIVKRHPDLGYKILADNCLNYHIRNVALMHHERCDGSGYPKGLKDREIDYFAKLVSIVDVYDAMTSPRVYRGAMCPFDVIKTFEDEGLQKYDSEGIMIFLKRIADSYLGEMVRLSDERTGKIIYINIHDLSRPTIQLQDGILDLHKEKELFIKDML